MGLWGGIEAGGTKMVCAVGTGPDDLRDESRFPTTSPAETLGRCIDYFREAEKRHGRLSGIGVGSFGPVDPDPASPGFGYVTTTPKPGWAHTDVVGPLRKALGVPVGFDTDVNGAALGEHRWGAAQGLDTFVYLTIGTGIGGGGVVGGQVVHGLVHPEMGHMYPPHDRVRDPFNGVCPYHGDCLEGLASGPAIEQRWGQPGHTLPEDHPAWALEADYLAYALVNLVCILSPQRLILGGGVMDQGHLFPLIRIRTQELLNGYVQHRGILEEIEAFIVAPGLGNRAGILGALALAEQSAM